MLSESQASECEGKQRFRTYEEAARLQRGMNRRYRHNHPYRCHWCQGYHLGKAFRVTAAQVRRAELRQRAEEEDGHHASGY